MRRVIIYILLGVLFFSSCKSSKKMMTQTLTQQNEIISLYDSITKHYGDFSTLSVKFSIDSKDFKSLPVQVKGTIRIKKDSIIWISIAPTMNIEMVRCVLTQDSVKFYSKIQKSYYENSIDSLTNSGNIIDFKTVQSILLDELFFCDQNENTDTLALLKSFETNIKNNSSVLKAHPKKEYKKNDTLSLQQIWTVDNTIFRISDVEIMNDNVAENNEMLLRIHYGNFQTFQDIIFPTMISIKAKKPNKKLSLDLNFSKVSFNEDLSFPFTKYDKYQKIEFKN